MDDAFYFGTNVGPVNVRAGTTVELLNANSVPDGSARFTSTAVPPGGTGFDSGLLTFGGMFRFAPNLEGIWNFKDQVSGVTGTLIVGPPIAEEWRCHSAG
jgi:hypothetical protein